MNGASCSYPLDMRGMSEEAGAGLDASHRRRKTRERGGRRQRAEIRD